MPSPCGEWCFSEKMAECFRLFGTRDFAVQLSSSRRQKLSDRTHLLSELS